MNGTLPTIQDVLARFDRVVEVGIGHRTAVAASLADEGVSVLATDRIERSVPDGVAFVRDDVTDPDPSIYADVEAIYALRLPPELQQPVADIAATHELPLYFTTLGGDPPVVPATLRTVQSGTLYVHRIDRGPGHGQNDDPHVSLDRSPRGQDMKVDAVVLDIDGVLVDVANSYRRAIVRTVEVVYGDSVSKAQVQSFKDAGGFNNDWVATDAIALYVLAQANGLGQDVETFTAAIESQGGGVEGTKAAIRERLPEPAAQTVLDHWDPDRLRTVFQQLYLGPDGYRELEAAEPDLYKAPDGPDSLPPEGFMADEPVLIDSETVESLAETYDLGVVTGRPRKEARLALDRVGLSIPADQLFAMEDHPGKPDPTGLVSVAKGAGAAAVAFAGDTRDDIRTARNATAADTDRTYHGIGVLTGGLSGESGRRAFESVGATSVIETVNELPSELSPR